jgi:anti-sigma B factor antagonist
MTGRGGKADGSRLQGDVSYVQGGAVLRLRGELDMSSASALLDRCKQLLSSPILRLDLDLEGVTFVDSTGISALIETRRVAKREGAGLRLLGVQHAAMRAFEVAGIAELFEIQRP